MLIPYISTTTHSLSNRTLLEQRSTLNSGCPYDRILNSRPFVSKLVYVGYTFILDYCACLVSFDSSEISIKFQIYFFMFDCCLEPLKLGISPTASI